MLDREEVRQKFLAGQEVLFDHITTKHGGVLMENANSGDLGLRVYKLYMEEDELSPEQIAARVDSWILDGTADVANTPDKKIDEALNCAFRLAGIDGAHHKDYCIDQMVRALTGNNYRQWVKDYEDGEEGPETYYWETGCP